MSANVVLSCGGDYVDILNPDMGHLRVEVIASSLSKQCRYVGHCDPFYSVARHCVLVARIVRDDLGRPDLMLEALMHEASEAFLGDVNTILKSLLPEYKVIEHNFDKVVAARYALDNSEEARRIIKRADWIALATERQALLPATDYQWPILKDIPLYSGHVSFDRRTCHKDELDFLNMYNVIQEERRQ